MTQQSTNSTFQQDGLGNTKGNNVSLKPVSPVAFRDGGFLGRDNVNQTGTTRYQLFPQNACQDIVLGYTNCYANGTTAAANTNAINIKASLEINGVIYPVFFNGKRTVTIEGGAMLYSDTVGCAINVGDSVWVRTYFDCGAAGYVPTIATLTEINTVRDGVTYGSDMTDSGTVTGVGFSNAYVPSVVLGYAKTSGKSFLLIGDSIVNGSGDVIQLLGNSGFAARKLYTNKIGSTKLSMGGETAVNFLASLPYRGALMKNHTSVICNYGINDILSNTPAATLQSYLIRIWKYFSNKGLEVYQATYTPRTTSTDQWLTRANQTPFVQEPTRLQMNSWLRDPSNAGAVAQSGGALKGIIDTASTVEVSGRWLDFPDAIYTGTVQSATATTLVDAALAAKFTSRLLDITAVVKITSGTGSGQINTIKNNYVTNTLQMNTSWTTTPDATSKYSIYYIPTIDGLHPSSKGHILMSNAVNVT